MKFCHRLTSLFCGIFFFGLVLTPAAQAWTPPKAMGWDEFYALYQTAGQLDAPEHTVTLTSELVLSGDGVYELGPTQAPVVVAVPGRTGIVVSGEAKLVIDNPSLTILAEDNETAAILLNSKPAGGLELKACAIETVDCPAILLMAAGDSLVTGTGGRVHIDVRYEKAAEGTGVRAGLVSGAVRNVPVCLRQVDLTVIGGDAAVYLGDDLELYDSTVRALSDPPVPAVLFAGDNTLTLDETSVVEPLPEAAHPPETSKIYQVTGVLPGDGTQRERTGWCIAGTAPEALSLPKTGIVYYEAQDGTAQGSLSGIALCWALNDLPHPLTAGEYTLYGAPDAAALLVEGEAVENPAGLAAEFALTVWAAGAPSQITVESNPAPNGTGRLATYKNLPPLRASGAVAAYIEYSTDKEHWARAKINTASPADAPSYSENILDAPGLEADSREFSLVIPAEGFYTRVQIEGGPFAGVSNVIEHGVLTPPAEEDDDGGGDRGGGGQGEHDRPGRKDEPAITPQPAPRAPSSASPMPEAAGQAEAPADKKAAPAPPPSGPPAADGAGASQQPPAAAVQGPGPVPPAASDASSGAAPGLSGAALGAAATAVLAAAGAAWFFLRKKKK